MKIQDDIVPTLRTCGVVTMDNLVISAKVRRGPDWDWDNQDNGGEGVIITEVDGYPGWVEVIWDYPFSFTYRIGYENKYDLEYV